MSRFNDDNDNDSGNDNDTDADADNYNAISNDNDDCYDIDARLIIVSTTISPTCPSSEGKNKPDCRSL